MLIFTKRSITVDLFRSGGAIILARLDFWEAEASDWKLIDTCDLHHVKQAQETQTVLLPPGSYSVVSKFRVEESINGVYNVDIRIDGKSVSARSGNIDSSSNPHDAVTFKNQFVMNIA